MVNDINLALVTVLMHEKMHSVHSKIELQKI